MRFKNVIMTNKVLFFSFWYKDVFFQDIICFLIVGTDYGAGDTNTFTVRMMSYDQIFDLFGFLVKNVFIFIWHIIRFVPIWTMMLSGIFLDLELSETLDLLLLHQGKIAPLSSCYLRVLLSSNLLSLNLVLLTLYLFSILLAVWLVRFRMDLTVMRCSYPRRYLRVLILAGE